MKLEPNLHTLVWGTESWEVSAHRSSPSIIADGPDKGRALSEVKPDDPRQARIEQAIDGVRKRFGKEAISPGTQKVE